MHMSRGPFAPALAMWLAGASCAGAQTLKEVPAAPVAQQTGPIISDDDFNAALPSLTPEQTQPETQAQPATTGATTTEAAKPGTTAAKVEVQPPPPQASPDAPMASDLAPVAPITDEDLVAPLSPLSGFDTEPLGSTAAPPPSTTAPPQIEYDTVVEGLPRGQLSRFNELSALKSGKGKAANASMVRARATEDEALLLRLLKSEGYYDGTVVSSVTTPAKGNGHVQAHLVVSPGKAYKLGNITIHSDPVTPPELIREALPLRRGDPIVADQVLAAEANVSVVLPQNGYPFAQVKGRDIALDPQTGFGDYTLNVNPGDRSRFGGFRSDGDAVFKANHIAELTRFKPGDLYDNRKVDDLRQALVATSLFRSVAVEPVKTGKTNPDGTNQVDLLVHETRGPEHSLAAEAGYSTGQGFTATGSWTDRNLFPPEGALILTGTLGTQEQEAGITFKRSNAHERDRTVTYGLVTDHTDETYEAYTATLNWSVSKVSTPIWQKEWTWSYGANLVASHETQDPTVAHPVYTNYLLLDVPLKLSWDKSDDLLNPTRGYRVTGQVIPEGSLGGTAANIEGLLDASVYHALAANLVLAGRVRLGSIVGGSLSGLAPSRRLYAGGGGSVRGFAYQALGPVDSSGNPTGGLSVTEVSIEARYRIGTYGIVPFIDAGQVYNSPLPQFSKLRVGAGIGARLYTNFGPLRIDIATPLSSNKRDVAVALYVGIGQAF